MQIHFFQQNNYKSITQYCWRSDFAVMSVTIHLEDFQSWSEVFQEIERQRRMRLFEIIQPNPSVTNDREKKRKAFVGVPGKRRFSERGMNHASPRKVYKYFFYFLSVT